MKASTLIGVSVKILFLYKPTLNSIGALSKFVGRGFGSLIYKAYPTSSSIFAGGFTMLFSSPLNAIRVAKSSCPLTWSKSKYKVIIPTSWGLKVLNAPVLIIFFTLYTWS
jgi:hypothetical protein